MAPAAFFSAVWAGLVGAFGLIFPNLDPYWAGSFWILTTCIAFLAGSLVGHRLAAEEYVYVVSQPNPRPQLPLLAPLVVLANTAGLIEIAYLFVRRGASPLSGIDIVGLVAANRAGNYGWGPPTQQPVEWFAFLLTYTGALFGGVLFRLSRVWWEKVCALVAVVLVGLVSALYGSRFGALYGGSFWLAAYIAASIWVGGSENRNARQLLRLGLVALLLLSGASVATQVIRYWGHLEEIGWRTMYADGFSFVGAFSIWFRDHGLVWSDFTLGARTFKKVVAPFGIQEAPLPSIVVDFTYSNIYTVFRDVIEDFGIVGSIVFFALLGYIGRRTYARVIAGHLSTLPYLVLVYAFILTSFATSVFFYTVPTAALALFTIYFFVVTFRRDAAKPSAVSANDATRIR